MRPRGGPTRRAPEDARQLRGVSGRPGGEAARPSPGPPPASPVPTAALPAPGPGPSCALGLDRFLHPLNSSSSSRAASPACPPASGRFSAPSSGFPEAPRPESVQHPPLLLTPSFPESRGDAHLPDQAPQLRGTQEPGPGGSTGGIRALQRGTNPWVPQLMHLFI